MQDINRRDFLRGAALTIATLGFSGSLAMGAGSIKLRKLYNKDLSFSNLALSKKDKRVQIKGYMAPPLKAESNFFVLTKKPMAVCPFCETDADWPDDILAIYTKRTVKTIPFNVLIEVNGILQLGSYTDPDTGFVSRVRLIETTYDRL